MDKKEKVITFDAFLRKAEERLEIKRSKRIKTLYVPSLDENITIRSLSKSEIREVFDIEDTEESDTYSCYIGVESPNLREIATKLKEDGKIKEYTEVVDIFKRSERTEIVMEIMRLSEVLSKDKVKVVEDIKN